MIYYVATAGCDVVGAFTKLGDAKRALENEASAVVYQYVIDVNAETIRRMLAEEPFAKKLTRVWESDDEHKGGVFEVTLED